MRHRRYGSPPLSERFPLAPMHGRAEVVVAEEKLTA
jgi:hypothetical protein